MVKNIWDFPLTLLKTYYSTEISVCSWMSSQAGRCVTLTDKRIMQFWMKNVCPNYYFISSTCISGYVSGRKKNSRHKTWVVFQKQQRKQKWTKLMESSSQGPLDNAPMIFIAFHFTVKDLVRDLTCNIFRNERTAHQSHIHTTFVI